MGVDEAKSMVEETTESWGSQWAVALMMRTIFKLAFYLSLRLGHY